MPRGGHANSGPPPDPMSDRSFRRRAAGEALAVGWIVLPITGRTEPAPVWPLIEPSARELQLWASLWARPQATEWERLGQHFEVALYVRRLAEVERPDSSAALGSLLIRLGEALGLTIPGLQARRWQIGATRAELASVTPLPNDPRPGAPISARDRIRRGSGDVRDRFAGPNALRRPDHEEAAAAAGGED